jgi:hypothetical protein
MRGSGLATATLVVIVMIVIWFVQSYFIPTFARLGISGFN